MTPFEERVYQAVRQIPRGKVATYAAVARAIGKPRAARAVGNALNKNPYPAYRGPREAGVIVPCHRVVQSDGSVGGFRRGSVAKAKLLREEGVAVTDKGAVPRSAVIARLPQLP